MIQTESRHDPRLSLKIPVRCEGPVFPHYRTLGFTRNVSRRGLELETPHLVPRGSSTALRLLMGDWIAEADAEVVWAAGETSGRMGLRFIRMAERDRNAWEKLIAIQAGSNCRASLRVPIDLEVTCLIPLATPLTGRMLNVGEGGLLVVLTEAAPPRTRLRVVGPDWLLLPRVEADVMWTRTGPDCEGVLHGLRVLDQDVGKELFLIGTILKSFVG